MKIPKLISDHEEDEPMEEEPTGLDRKPDEEMEVEGRTTELNKTVMETKALQEIGFGPL